MTTVYTRTTTAAGASNQNAPLTSAQVDANFINLNADKAPLNGIGTSGTWPINITGNAANVSWSGVTDKPAIIAAGATAADARTAIGAGTSNLVIGTTAGTAMAGDATPFPEAPTDSKTYGRKDAAWAEVVAGPAGSSDNEVALFDGATGKLIKGGGVLNTGAYAEEGRWKLQAFYVMAMTPAVVPPSWALGSYYPYSDQVVENGHTAARGNTGDIYTMTDGVWVLTDPFNANSNGSRIVFAQTGDVTPFLWTRSTGVTVRTPMTQGCSHIRYSEGTAGVDFTNYTVRNKLNEIGRLINLTTTSKTDIVAAINELATALGGKADLANPTFTGTVGGITKGMVGLGNVDNTSDLDKPISTAAQGALDALEATIGDIEAALVTINGE